MDDKIVLICATATIMKCLINTIHIVIPCLEELKQIYAEEEKEKLENINVRSTELTKDGRTKDGRTNDGRTKNRN